MRKVVFDTIILQASFKVLSEDGESTQFIVGQDGRPIPPLQLNVPEAKPEAFAAALKSVRAHQAELQKATDEVIKGVETNRASRRRSARASKTASKTASK